MSTIDLAQFKDLYVKTATQYLHTAQADLEKLQANPTQIDLIKALHITAHSLKGQDLAMHFTSTAQLCGTLEYIFRDVEAGTLVLSQELLSDIKAAFTAVGQSVASIQAHDTEIDLTEMTKRLESLTGVKYAIPVPAA